MKKKLFIISEAISDNDGNLYSTIHSIHYSEEEAIKELENYYNEVITHFDLYEDDYEHGDKSFDIHEYDDITVRNYAVIETIEIEV